MITRIICRGVLLMIGMSLLISASIIEDGLQSTTTTRATGMGNAFTSLAHSDGAIQFNPAGLAIKGGQYSLQFLFAFY